MELRAKANEDGYFKYLYDEFAKNGILYLGASVSSEAQVQTVLYLGKEITSLADLKGMKIASVGGSNKAFIESLGATVIPIDFTDYFTSMERGRSMATTPASPLSWTSASPRSPRPC